MTGPSTPVNQTLLRMTLAYRLMNGWRIINDGSAVTNFQQQTNLIASFRLVPPNGDLRHHWCTRWFVCESAGVRVPEYAFHDDPEVPNGNQTPTT